MLVDLHLHQQQHSTSQRGSPTPLARTPLLWTGNVAEVGVPLTCPTLLSLSSTLGEDEGVLGCEVPFVPSISPDGVGGATERTLKDSDGVVVAMAWWVWDVAEAAAARRAAEELQVRNEQMLCKYEISVPSLRF